ncbi:MAG: AEC family transporter, partial [bacterium]
RSPGLYLSAMFMNAGYMGLPLVALAFGEGAITAAVIYVVAEGVVDLSRGIGIVSKERSLKEISRLPIIYVTAFSLLLNFCHVGIPDFIYTPFRLLGDAVIPLMLFALGYQLRSVRFASVPAALAASVIRNLGGMAVAIAFCHVTGVGGVERKVIILLSATPSAVVNFVIARKYNSDSDLVSSIVLLSTILSIGTITLTLFLIERYF